MDEKRGTDWLCVDCGHVLGTVIAGELMVKVPPEHSVTRGPHLVVRCPDCQREKTFYTADPLVRAIYQLVDAVTAEFARRFVREIGSAAMKAQKNEQQDNSPD